tara:strand:+ start:231 stop:575 length:345 start_codon:yes stop_codon:yes gene_type:complete
MAKAFSGKVKGASHERGGVKARVARQGRMIEVEGGEYIVNKESAKKFKKQLVAINKDPASVAKLKPLPANKARMGRNIAKDPTTGRKKRVKHASDSGVYRRGGYAGKHCPGMGK